MTKVLSVSLTLQAELQAGISPQLVEVFAQRKASEVQAAMRQRGTNPDFTHLSTQASSFNDQGLSVSLDVQAELQAGICQLVEAFAQRKASEVQAAAGQRGTDPDFTHINHMPTQASNFDD